MPTTRRGVARRAYSGVARGRGVASPPSSADSGKLREATGAMGCDAVVLTGATEHSGNPARLFDEDTKTLIAALRGAWGSIR